MGNKRNAYRVLVALELSWKIILRWILESYIRVVWIIGLTQDMDQLGVLLNMAMTLCVL
jgi:hypothetical protein